MDNKSYSQKLKDPRWQKKRLEIFKRDKWKCKKCGDDTETLHVHHLKYNDCEPWEYESKDLVTLCELCHFIVEQLNNDGVFYENIIIYKKSNGKYRFVMHNWGIDFVISTFDMNTNVISSFKISDNGLISIKKFINKYLKIGNGS